MPNFNLNKALANWRQTLKTEGPLEPGYLDELESGLLDRFDEYLLKGDNEAEAFKRAVAKTSPANGETTREFARATARPGTALLGGYLKLAWRNLSARRWFNLLNFCCLTLGLVTTALVAMYLNYETSYDDFVPDADRKYRLGMTLRSQGYSTRGFADYNGTSAAAQRASIAGVAAVRGVSQAVQLMNFPDPQRLRANDKELATEDLLQTNTPGEFLDFFGWKVLTGDPAAFAAAPNTALLTERQAIRFFGDDWRGANPVGQSLRIDTTDYTIAGVLANVPPNAHFDFSVALHSPKIDYWGARTYVKLPPGEAPADVGARIDENMGAINASLATNELFGGTIIQPLRSLHLGSDLLYEMKPPGDVRYLYIIGFIGLIILLLTVSNYTNLSVAMNAGRAREIGMRKVFGATDGQIAGQFLLEASVLSLLCVPVAAGLLWWLLPRFDTLMGTALEADAFRGVGFWALLLGASLVIGLLAGAYPAFVLARTRVQKLFEGNALRDAGRGIGGRKILITVQFVLLIGLCSLTLFVNRQLDYLQTKDLGYVRDGILYVNVNADSSRFATFRNELLRLPEVESVGSGTPMGAQPYNQLTYKLAGREEVFDDANNIYLDYTAVGQLGLETSIPDYIARPEEAPARLVLINETLAARLRNQYDQTDAELIGQSLLQEPEYTNEETGQVGFPYVIGGTFRDVNMFSLRERVDPMFLTLYREPRYVYTASISYQDAAPADVLNRVRGVYESLNFNEVFTHNFLADNLEELYLEEERIATLSTAFSLIAFLTAVLGLIGLTAYLTTLKRKEIAVRKILGAADRDILLRFNREYLPLLAVAMVITVPLAWWGISSWLAGFAYRIGVNPLVFLLAGLITLVVTVLAVSLLTLRAVLTVPARGLMSGGG